MFKSLIGDKKFYKTVLLIALPIMLQQGITSFVSLLDNIMIGQLNQEAIEGVNIANQILFIIMMALSGGLAGPGIFIAQYNGAKDDEGVRQSFRVKLIFAVTISIIGFLIIFFNDRFLASLFLDKEASIDSAVNYFKYATLTIIPICFIQVYGTSLREIGHAIFPMIAGIVAVVINITLNYLLIYGNYGFPNMGVSGASLATLIARIVEALMVITYSHIQKFNFAHHVYRDFRISRNNLINITKKGLPVLGNEILWSGANTLLVFAYSLRGGDAVASVSITSITMNLFYVSFNALASGVAILVGSELGSNNLEGAYDNAKKLVFFSVSVCIGLSIILFFIAPYVPLLFNISANARSMATKLLRIMSFMFPVFMYNTNNFFVLRAGGRTVLAFIFDSCFMWTISVPLALLLGYLTTLPLIYFYGIIQSLDLLKIIPGYKLFKSKIWIKNLTI